ncbi:FdtA/QdtA family cupin domain-containing protein [Patescibacteria group bacterium]|nr:FdtA/QdtA family cupin domain-containing protein [Patescibacteria group bacterium]
MGLFKKIILPIHKNERFSLIPLEVKERLDFTVERVYALLKASQPTGSHCHKVEKECFICLVGQVTAVIDSNGLGCQEVILKTGEAIYVGNYVWHHFKDFSQDCVLMALSSTNYDSARQDYINDYAEFVKQAKR